MGKSLVGLPSFLMPCSDRNRKAEASTIASNKGSTSSDTEKVKKEEEDLFAKKPGCQKGL